MINKISLHEGEILRILIKRAGMRVDDAAPKFGLVPNSLSRIFKTEKLSKKVKANAIKIFGLDKTIFETGLGYELPEFPDDRVGESDFDYMGLLQDNERLIAENARLAEELLREKSLSDDLRKVLVQITKQGPNAPPEDTIQYVSGYGRRGKAQKSG